MVGLLALVGVVIVVTAVMSGFMERANLPQVAVFLLLGLAIGPRGLGLLDVGLDSPILHVVATLSLALVLFTDAVTLELSQIRKHARLAVLILGPGTIRSAAVIALLAQSILGLGWAPTLILAAALASTDPVMLRGLLKRRDLTPTTRQALRLESGLNDIVLLPLILIAMLAVGNPEAVERNVPKMLVNLFLLGPLAGAAVGFASIGLLRFARQTIGVRRDYESFYSLGVCFTTYAAAESIHASGFLACFAAGIVIAKVDEQLCDCFVEYGETTAEMLLMFTFVLLGGSLMWSGITNLTAAIAIFAALALLARPVSLLVSLSGLKMDRRSRGLIVWFGPRGLSTLLLILLPVFAGTPGAEGLFHVSTTVVVLSIIVHGFSIMVLGKKQPGPSSVGLRKTPPRRHDLDGNLTTSVEELRSSSQDGKPFSLVDARSAKSFDTSNLMIKDSVRVDPDDPAQSATELKLAKDAWLAIFCT